MLDSLKTTFNYANFDGVFYLYERKSGRVYFKYNSDRYNVNEVEAMKRKLAKMEEIPGSEQILDADLVLIAAGFLGAQAYVTDAFGVEMTPRTNVSTKIGHYSTSVDKVFTAGDMHRGQSLVVWAIREGREAAKEVDQYLMGYTNLN